MKISVFKVHKHTYQLYVFWNTEIDSSSLVFTVKLPHSKRQTMLSWINKKHGQLIYEIKVRRIKFHSNNLHLQVSPSL